jgi:hypothetical protein
MSLALLPPHGPQATVLGAPQQHITAEALFAVCGRQAVALPAHDSLGNHCAWVVHGHGGPYLMTTDDWERYAAHYAPGSGQH